MKVWIVLITKDYPKVMCYQCLILLGVFSTKQKAIDRITSFCGQTPNFENDIYWSPEFDEGDDDRSDGYYTLLEIDVDSTQSYVRLYAE